MTIFTTYSGPFGRTGTQTVQHHSNSPRLVLPDCRGTIPTKVSYQGPPTGPTGRTFSGSRPRSHDLKEG